MSFEAKKFDDNFGFDIFLIKYFFLCFPPHKIFHILNTGISEVKMKG